MTLKQLLSTNSKIGIFLVSVLLSPAAGATQPISDFIAGARSQSFDAREKEAVARQRSWEAEAARGRLLPSLTARGLYTRNQFEAGLPAGTFPGQTEAVTITPQNQFDATFQLDVPLLDLSSYQKFRQTKHLSKAAELQREAQQSDIDRAVVQAYYTFLGAEALVDASERTQKSAEQNLTFITTRAGLGAATDLDRERAKANVESAKQDRADAELLRVTARRNLETLSGVQATPAQAFPVDDLGEEEPLATWLEKKDTPFDRVQAELNRAARAAKKGAAYSFLPTLSANGQERLSNASGFAGQTSSYALSAMLTLRLDYSTYANAEAQAVAAEVQAIAAERTRRNVEDLVYESYFRVKTNITKSSSARAQAEAASKAADLALERYQAGAVTQLDVIQSQREAFSAQASRIKADADLALSRALLRLAAGEPIDSAHVTYERREPALETEATPEAPSASPVPPETP